MLLLQSCVAAQMVVAYDSSRMMTLGFIVMIPALKHLFEHNPFEFRRWAGWVVLANLVLPQVQTWKDRIEIMRSPLDYTIEYLLR